MIEVKKWIPISERLPELERRVLITDEHGDVDIAYYTYYKQDGERKIVWWAGSFKVFPTAWMPLPESWKGK